ncbi:MAG TPA: NAD(P)H-dependent oxidoreductase subunit E [Gemmatimonadota bacterium]|nr:NAD(P)H-dependent oxidoreductase subunit E [Gemmatimonadota bacterium]
MSPFTMPADAVGEIERAIASYPEKQAAMLPVLWVVQREKGWISPEAMVWVGERLDCSAAAVQSVVKFYTMFDEAPVGRWKLQVCRTLSCELMGARAVIDRIRERLGIEPGETTADGEFTLQEVECLASCGTGPMMQCNFKFYEHLTLDRIDSLLDDLRSRTPDSDDVEPVIYERPDPEAYHTMFPRSLGLEVESR